MGMLASSIVHQTSQPISAVTAMLEVLVNEESLSSSGLALAERIQRRLDRMQHTAVRLRRFARRTGGGAGKVHLPQVLEEALTMVDHDFRISNIELVRRYQPDLPAARGDSGALEHVFLNLLTNARDAMAGRAGTLTITAESHKVAGGRRSVAVRIQDQGPGIPEDVHPHIFEPLFTTKESGQGLGLSICQRIVDRHGGTISVETDSNGTCFSVILPAWESARV